MQLVINGQRRDIAGEPTVAELLSQLSLPAQRVAVELNKQLIPRARHAEVRLAEDDVLEIVTLVGGG